MSFDAGEVTAELGARLVPLGFIQFEGALKGAQRQALATEAAIAGSSKRSSAAMGGMATQAGRTSSAMGGMGAVAGKAAAGGVLALSAGLVASVVSAARFQTQMSEVKAVTKASESDLRRLASAAKDLGAESGLGATKTAKAIAELAKGGVTTAQILEGGLKGAIDLAVAGELDLATAAETVATALGQFGLGGDQATHVADALATAANKTTADVGDFAMGLSQAGGAARIAGLTFDETVAALEALTLAGVKGSDAGTSLKTMLTQVAKPSKESATAMKELGLEFFTAEGNLKSLPALAGNMREAFGDLTREQFLNKTATIGGQDALRALFAIYNQGEGGMRRLLGGLKEQGAASDIAATKQDNLAGAWNRFKATMENVAIDAGTPVLNGLTDGVDAATDGIKRLRDVADDLDDSVVGDAVRGIADAFDDVKARLGDGSAGYSIAGLFGMDPSEAEEFGEQMQDAGRMAADAIEWVAGALADIGVAKGVDGLAEIAEGVADLAGGLARLGSAVPSLDFGQMFSGLDQLASGALGIVDGFANTMTAPLRAISSTVDGLLVDPFRRGADAILGLVSTIADALADMYGGLSGLPVIGGQFQNAAEGLRTMADSVNGLRDSINGVPENKTIRVTATAEQALAALDSIRGTELEPQVLQILATTDNAEDKIAFLTGLGIPPKTAEILAEISEAMGDIDSVEAAAASIRDGKVRVEPDTGSAVAAIRDLQGTDIEPKFLEIIGRDGDAKSKMRALIKLGIPPKEARAIAEVSHALGGIASVSGALAALNGSVAGVTVRVRVEGTVPKGALAAAGSVGARAAGRGPIGAETALVGEGRVPREYIADPATGRISRVDQPTFMDLSPSAYVIPVDPTMRGRSLGLFADLAQDLGIPGFADSKKPSKRKTKPAKKEPAKKPAEYKVPPKIAEGGVKFSEVESDYKDARNLYQRAGEQVEAGESAVAKARKRVDQAKSEQAKKTARESLRQAQRELRSRRALKAKRKRPFERAEADWKAAKKTDDESQKLQSEINLARDAMDDAAKRKDGKAFGAARGDRESKLRSLIGLLQRALSRANPKSAHARDLREKLSHLGGKGAVEGGQPDGGELLDALTDEAPEDPETPEAKAKREAFELYGEDGLTEAEENQLKDLDAAEALAALTDGLDDDKQAAGRRVTFLEQMLAAAMQDPSRGGSAVIAEIAGQVKQARERVATLTSGRGTVDDPDLQAQIDQANARREAAEAENAANIAALRTFGGSGDVGTGRYGNALDAARDQPTVIVNTLHPGDPRTLRAIGDAATGGQNLQSRRGNPPARMGI